MNPETNNVNSSKSNNSLIIILSILVIAALVFCIMYYVKINNLKKDPAKISEEKALEVVNIVNKIIDLPKGEVPALATVTDTKPLANNPFFTKAKVGDQVLFYTVAKKAFLYDPKQNVIVEVAAFNIGK